ncbi:hypothetical protein NLHDIDDJ_02447 [Acinetobacter baumannii]|uniref:hypothetical protein n=1 Tax=Acinetobacter baumannii TaxID=470 RepID=UPI001E282863|nr:hypothetical protein [Acinetobacter baumannii]UDY20792.1 hypothetical protein NLHDIDDJ_02447 [Acinetobacter baumannii]
MRKIRLEGGYVKLPYPITMGLDSHECIYSNMTPEIAKALGFNRTSELEKMNTPKQINVVISTKVSDDISVKQKVDEALASLYSITYDELTDDIWQAIKLLQKSQK